MSVALIKARDWESESKIKRLVGDLSHHHWNSEYLNGLRNSLTGLRKPGSAEALTPLPTRGMRAGGRTAKTLRFTGNAQV